ncbi:dihydroxyacetone kinase subunit DhaK [Kitasatospora aureofaciens]|uniref:phosphoenolpyruvate--glycerone phosphotransferase n=1 Tax=Kitasatospora aureofaciens TaxID=1894 RepID=A0A1E7MZB7_KITAU|nr:dihydroxyacetone kinase subunit DhaK [Kitasatospora aureofaciens]QEU99618.1 dihydroxyacetone kinase subunit DhaK [Streptomyces viridifaciens]ARF78406.1 dihydroxyacetone kinase subunit DhaK [Kitasatospora aureofaciens]OEV33778.1 dihydroxyacetone kinase subunit DhaK [Kitasatospora aureofaciens]UKZ05724.1 dihydroxyacetone kinase subunit DhaK [Streptomyces viridifaciens]GGU79443.1 dihydroxyacetone kinase subunit DhaK [Kitasatospora aureofaciens]
MKKLINTPESVLEDALAGFAAAHPELTVDIPNRVITRAARPAGPKVALVSGGGSGHEPLHGGFVGPGMLDAACPGEVFTSPVPDQMLAAAKAVENGAGVVFVVKNYTGDVMNFELAAEVAAEEGLEVRTVLVNDDVAVEDSTWTAGRRGTGATVLVEKTAGALAERGAGLDEVAALGERVNAASRSFAVALTAATVPAAGKPGFDLPEDEIEVGVGIHGEPGRRREKLRPARELAAEVVETVLADHHLTAGDEVIALLNGLGATPLLELYVVYGEVAARLAERGITVARSLVGNYVTSLDMAGFSLTLTQADAQLLDLWDAPVDTPALKRA